MSLGLSEEERPWYFGEITRETTNKVLVNLPNGSYLVRDSNTHKGGYVIAVKENRRINRYLIKRKEGWKPTYVIGQREFDAMDDLIEYYRSTSCLGESRLFNPAPKWVSIAIYKYEKLNPDDLSVERGELLEFIMQKEEWTLCRSQTNKLKGWIPSNRMEEYNAQQHAHLRPSSSLSSFCQLLNRQNQLPSSATVIRNRNPNIYNDQQLRLEVGETVSVRRILKNGMCEVFHNNLEREGLVPISFIEFENSARESGTIL